MKQIIRTSEGIITIGRMTENLCDPLDFLLELDSISKGVEKKLQKAMRIEKEKEFERIKKGFPERLKRVGYKRVEDIPEYTVYTGLDLRFSDKGKGLVYSGINRSIVDRLDGDTCNFEVDVSLPVELELNTDELKKLALTYLEKIIFKPRTVENYVF